MIPKLIHYCWFGGNPLPPLAQKCLSSWKKYFPDFVINEWNERNYNPDKIPYTADAHKLKKYAFVSDYARFDILYQFGGVYFDTDVEVLKSFDKILSNGSFLGMETAGRINPGVGCAFNAGNLVLKNILDYYQGLCFINSDGSINNSTVVDYTTNIFIDYGFKNKNELQKINDVNIYPVAYFNPIDYDTHYRHITAHTHSIHHGTASWVNGPQKMTAIVHMWLCRVFGKRTGRILSAKFRKLAKSIYLRCSCRFLFLPLI
ncbi:glycosyl transferase [Spirochaetia bacterium]|nr:glycosyl transferase [Spirochaetia bacterium]